MSRFATACWVTGLACAGARADADAPRFTRPPTAKTAAEGLTIEFAVDRETDAAVWVEDARGKVVRHLVAGRLGMNAPAPLVVGAAPHGRPEAGDRMGSSLQVSLAWDEKDDLGHKAEGGPFRVRVGLGLKPTFGRLIGAAPADVGGVRALAVGPGSEVYVFHAYGSHHPHDASTAIAVFGRDGKYLRTIMPYPAGLPDAKLAGVKRLSLEDGSKVPFIYQFETRALLPTLGDAPSVRPVVTADGRLAFVGVLEGPAPYAQPGEARLTVIGTDGSVPTSPLRTRLAWISDSGASLALSPDEKTLYATGLRVGTEPGLPGPRPPDWNHGETWQSTKPTHAVYRFAFDDAEPAVLIGDPAKPGSGPAELNYPTSLATDAAGNIYVADLGNHRIAVFKPDGTPLGQVPVREPQRVEVHRKTGAVYVLAGYRTIEVIKFDGWKRGAEVARLGVRRTSEGFYPVRRPVMALDDLADPPIVWLDYPFARVEDRGSVFGEPMPVRPSVAGRPASIAAVFELSVDRDRQRLYVNNYWRYDLAGERWERLPQPPGAGAKWPSSSPYAATGSVGRDGNYYMDLGAHGARVLRFGPDLRLLPFARPATSPFAKDAAGQIAGYARSHGCGLTADHRGNVYVIWKEAPVDPGDFHRANALYVYDREGRLTHAKLINTSIPGHFSPRVDYAGNIYVAAGLRPGKDWLPPGLKGQVPEAAEDPDAVNRVNGYPQIYGSILKFGPEGGEIRQGAGGVACTYGFGRPIEVKGARWIVPGVSTVSSWSTPKAQPNTLTVCLCEAACFDVDGFGRSFFPDAGRKRVGVIDAAGHLVTWFGRYGNADDAGLSFAWPQAVAVDDRAAYVGDRLNRRIVQVNLAYAAEASCAVP